MKFVENSELYSLNRSTYLNLRWIAFIGQILSIFFVEFILEFKFNYLPCLGIIAFGVITNIYLQFKIKENLISNSLSLISENWFFYGEDAFLISNSGLRFFGRQLSVDFSWPFFISSDSAVIGLPLISFSYTFSY